MYINNPEMDITLNVCVGGEREDIVNAVIKVFEFTYLKILLYHKKRVKLF